LIRILICDRDVLRLEQTKKYLQNFEDFRVSAAQYDEDAADEIRDDYFDVILYTISEKSNPETLLDEDLDISSLLLIRGNSENSSIFKKYPYLRIRYIDDEATGCDLAEIIRTSYTISNIENIISAGIKKFKSVFLKSPVPLALLNNSGRMINVNDEWIKCFECDTKDILGNDFFSCILDESKKEAKDSFFSVVKKNRGDRQSGVLTSLYRKDGNLFPARILFSGFFDDTEKSDRIICAVLDLSIQNASLKSLNFKSRLFDAVGTAVSSILNSKSVKTDISNLLHILGITLETSRITVFIGNDDITLTGEYDKKFEWCALEIKNCPEIEKLLTMNEGSRRTFLQEKPTGDKPLFIISQNTTKENQVILDICKTLSLLRIPVYLDNNKKLVIIIEDCFEKKKWEREDAETIIIASNILGMILRLKHIDFKNLSIIDNSPDIIGISSPNGTIEYSNSTIKKLLRISDDEKQSYNITDIFGNKNQKRLFSQIDSVIADKKPGSENYTFFFNNEERFANVLMYPVKNEFGIKNLIFFGKDLTEQKKYEKRLLMTQFAVESAPDSVFYSDKEGCIIYANKTACRLFNYSKNVILKKRIFDLISNQTENIYKETFSQLKNTGSRRYITELKSSDGRLISAEISENYLHSGDSEIICSYAREISYENKIKSLKNKS